MPTKEVAVVLSLKDQMSKPAQAAHASLGDLLKTGAGFGLGFAGVTSALSIAGGAFDFVKGAVIDFNSNLQSSKIGWTTMLGGAEAADKMLRDIGDFAKSTPFEFPDVERAGRLFVAMGGNAKDAITELTRAGNVASGLNAGTAGMETIIRVMGQMAGVGRVQAGDMMQLANLGVPAWDLLAKKMGMTVAQVRDLSEQGKISADVFKDAFAEFADTKFGGLMDAQSRTFLGALSNIKDSLTQTLAKIGKPLFDKIAEGALAFANALGSPQFEAFGQIVTAGIMAVFDAAGRLNDFIMPFILGLRELLFGGFGDKSALLKAFEDLNIPMPGLEHVIDLIQGLFSLISGGGDSDKIANALKGLNVPPEVIEGVKSVVAEFQKFSKAIGDFLAANPGLVTDILKTLAIVTGVVLVAALAVVGFAIVETAVVLVALGAAVAVAAQFVTGTLWPALQNLWSWITGTLIPTLSNLADWVGEKVTTALTILGAGWNVLWNVIKPVMSYITGTVIPFWTALANLATAILGLAIRTMAAIWTEVLLPAITDVWSFMSRLLTPAIDGARGAIETANPILQTLGNIAGFVRDRLSDLAGMITGALLGALGSLAGGVLGTIGNAFQGILNVVNNIIGALNTLAGIIRNLPTLPLPGLGGGSPPASNTNPTGQNFGGEGSGGKSLTVNIFDASDPYAIAQQIQRLGAF